MIVLFLLLVAFVAFSRGAITLPTSSIVIVGAGPAGLSAALMLERHGCRDITVIEKRSASSFESEKAYLYMLAPNGQKITDLLGMTASIASRSVSSFKMTTLRVVEPTGKVKVKSLPMRMTKEEKYWLPRSAFLDCYLEKVDEINHASEKAGAKPPIRLEFDTSCTNIVVDKDGKLQIDTIQRGKPKQPIRANIVIGCDGIGSVVRTWLASEEVQAIKNRNPIQNTFQTQSFKSDSAGLRYKILTLKPNFLLPADGLDTANITLPLRSEQKTANLPECTYSIRSVAGTRKTRFFLGLLPVREGMARTANIVCIPEHEIWSIRDGPTLKAYLQRNLPQLDIGELFADEELERFAASPGGTFPRPQYCDGYYQLFYPHGHDGGDPSSVAILAGDAAHAFPPDLGQGVNSALEDVFALHKALESTNDSIVTALERYQAVRLPEAKALCKLMVFGYPYQYNQSPGLRKLWLFNAALRMALSKVAPALFSPSAFQMVQNYDKTYAQVLKHAHRTTRNLVISAAMMLGGAVWAAVRLMTKA